jgi:hypothetical protein
VIASLGYAIIIHLHLRESREGSLLSASGSSTDWSS